MQNYIILLNGLVEFNYSQIGGGEEIPGAGLPSTINRIQAIKIYTDNASRGTMSTLVIWLLFVS